VSHDADLGPGIAKRARMSDAPSEALSNGGRAKHGASTQTAIFEFGLLNTNSGKLKRSVL